MATPTSTFALLLALVFAASAHAAENPRAVPTFECMSLYWDVQGGSPDTTCTVKYRPTAASTWHPAQPLWFDRDKNQYRGSVVHLQPDTDYQFQLSLPNGDSTIATARTWSNTFPVAETLTQPPGTSSTTLHITAGGSPDAYRLYTAAPEGTTIDVANSADTCIQIDADYVIVRGFTCRGARIHGIRVGNHRNVVIEGCDIAGWGRPDPAAGKTIKLAGRDIAIPHNLGHYLDAGIHIDGPDSQQVIIQGNHIHTPRYTSNNWTQPSPYFSRPDHISTHPQGPDAVVFAGPTRGRHVIRWNDIGNPAPDFDHMFYDALLAAEPQGNGFPCDGDIYGNRISGCWDDAIEAERGDRNIRIWDNHFSHVVKCVSSGYIWDGPLYVWRNVATDLLHPNAMPDHNGGFSPFAAHPPCFMPPPQEHPSENRDGIVYVYHNTLVTGRGAGAGWAFNTWPPHTYKSPTVRLVSRNNIWQTVPYPAYFTVPNPNNTNYCVLNFHPSYFDQDYDLHTGTITPATCAGPHTIQSEPTFQSGTLQLAPGTPGHGDALHLPNFNTPQSPDRSARKSGTPAPRYGTTLWKPKPQ